MAVELEAIAFVVSDAARSAQFWAALLGTTMITEPDGALVAGEHARVGLRFADGDAARLRPHRLHLHLTSGSPREQEVSVRTVLRLGGTHLDVGQSAAEKFVVMADPCGTPFCVIEPGNAYLADTGFLGEVTCDGTRAAGRFWRDALGWPLVWDQGDQTAVQSPDGGTKISWDAWVEPGARAGGGVHGQRFDLTTASLADESSRLMALGAAHVAKLSDGTEFADPDGHPFRLRAS